MAVQVLLEDFVVPKRTQFGTVHRSLGQDKVYIKNEQGVWKHCGYLGHASMHFCPLVGVPHELVQPIADECARQKKEKVTSTPSIPIDVPTDDEDEYEDE